MTKRTRLLPASLALVGALVLAGCGDADDTDATAGDAAATTEATPTGTASPTDAESVPQGDSAEADTVFGTAVQTAEAAVAGGRVIDYDLDDDEIDVEVVVDDVVHELELSADGTRVLSQERDDRLDGDDLAEVRGATIGIAEAVATALAQSPGTVQDVELDREDGVVRWEIEISGSAGESELYVDAETGALIG